MSPVFTGGMVHARLEAGGFRHIHHGESLDGVTPKTMELLRKGGFVKDDDDALEAIIGEDAETTEGDDETPEVPALDVDGFDPAALIEQGNLNAPQTIALAEGDPVRAHLVIAAECSADGKQRKGVIDALEAIIGEDA